MITTDTLIIGGGLSGLAVADGLHQAGRPFMLLDARSRLGGRILTEVVDGHGYDLGPAWFWPGQPLIDQLVSRLNITRFTQFTEGLMTAEDPSGTVQHVRAFAAMAGAWRLEGGMAALINAFATQLPRGSIQLGRRVVQVTQSGATLRAHCQDGHEIEAQRLVLALPPRLSATLDFVPSLPDAVVTRMTSVPTWMAGQAKALAVYENPFWRKAGLSGAAMSQRGPLIEVHDASPSDGGAGALFGFVGVPPDGRRDEGQLRSAVLDQLRRLFGPQAGQPEHFFLKDWAKDTHTAVDADQAPLMGHPSYGPPPALGDLWGGKLYVAGSEVAPRTGGFLEGALESASMTVDHIVTDHGND